MGAVPPDQPVDPVEGYTPRYRGDIDGLRAIAVVAVILYHFWGRALPGGFLGVDVFFVISGFLITRILVRENEARDYSILRFYDRRVRRIMPALLVMIAATTLVVWLIYLPVDAVGYAKSVVATLAFLSNVYFWRDGMAYFSSDAVTKPLLHTWSLGIEEQFYIVFPLLVWLLMKLGGQRAAAWGIGAIAVLSFAIALAATAVNAGIVRDVPLPINAWGVGVAAFYLLPARAWELGLGAGVALASDSGGAGTRRRSMFAGAAAALLLAALLVPPAVDAPLPQATFACLGTAILIRLGQRDNPMARLIGARPLVAIGLVSYSLYLWHWPVLVLGRYYLVQEPSSPQLLAMLALTGVLAALSWRFVEQPFRGHRLSTLHVLAAVVALGVAVGGTAFALLATHGAPGRLPPATAAYNTAMSVRFQCPAGQRVPFGGIDGCLLGVPGGSTASADVVLFGNSHAEMYAPAVERVLARRALKGLLVSTGGCLPFTRLNVSYECIALMRGGIDAVAGLRRADTVIVATTWPRGEIALVDAAGRAMPVPSWPRYLAAMQETVDRFERAGKRVILVGPVPWPGYDTPSVAARELAYRGRIETPLSQPRADYQARFGPVEAWLDTLAPPTTVVHPAAVLCNRATCAFQVGGKPAYFDDNHLSVLVMPAFEPLFAQALDKALPPSKRVD